MSIDDKKMVDVPVMDPSDHPDITDEEKNMIEELRDSKSPEELEDYVENFGNDRPEDDIDA